MDGRRRRRRLQGFDVFKSKELTSIGWGEPEIFSKCDSREPVAEAERREADLEGDAERAAQMRRVKDPPEVVVYLSIPGPRRRRC